MKVSNLNLTSLPRKSKSKNLEKDNLLVQIFDIHYEYQSLIGYKADNLIGLDFAIKNISNYPINNIQLFFVYNNYRDEVVSYSFERFKKTILPQLALQFNHSHHVKYFRKMRYGNNAVNIKGKIEIRILDYEIDRSVESSPVDLLFK